MKPFIKFILAVFLLVSISSNAQTNKFSALYHFTQTLKTCTNGYYHPHEMVYEATPTASLGIVSKSWSYGISIEGTYWQTEGTGTGIELGTYDLKRGFDHFSIMENYRIVPFLAPYDRLAIEGKIAAEHYFPDSKQDVGYGVGLDIALTHRVRIETDLMQFFRVNGANNAVRFRCGLQWVF